GDLVVALGTDPFGVVRGNAHLPAAVAEDDAGKEVYRPRTGLVAVGPSPEDRGARFPDLLVHDRGNRHLYPFALGLELPLLSIAQALGVVGAAYPLGRGVEDEAPHRDMGEEAPVSGPVALVVQEPGDRPYPFCLPEEFIHELADGGFLLVGDKH